MHELRVEGAQGRPHGRQRAQERPRASRGAAPLPEPAQLQEDLDSLDRLRERPVADEPDRVAASGEELEPAARVDRVAGRDEGEAEGHGRTLRAAPCP